MLRAYRKFPSPARPRTLSRLAGAHGFSLGARSHRAKGRRERHEHDATRALEDNQHEGNVEDLVASREFERQVAQALDALPEKLRIVMSWLPSRGYNTAEGRETGWPARRHR